MTRSPSIRGRLANALLVWSLLWSLGVAVAVGLAAQHEVDELLDETLQSYRSKVIASRLGALDSGTAEQKSRMCKGALAVLSGMALPGEWPSRGDEPDRDAAAK